MGCLAAITWCRLSVITKVLVHFYNVPPGTLQRSRQMSPCEDGYIYIPIAFMVMLYLVYLVECWHCHTRVELHCKVDTNTVYERIQAMREAMPVVWWKAVCYHYVRRTRQVTRYRNGDAFTTTQVYYERVISHTASSAFDFANCGIRDISKSLCNLEVYPATKIRLTKGFSFSNVEAENEFEDQRSNFFQEYERMDDYMETREGLDLLNVNNFKEYIMAFADSGHLPWYVSPVAFWVASALLLSWPVRVLVQYKTAYVHYHVHKLFGVNYPDTQDYYGRISRVSTMGSSDFEITISNNYTIVPSYSEALLMQGCTNSSENVHGNNIIPRSHSNLSAGCLVITNNCIPDQLSNGFADCDNHAHVILGQVGDLAYIIQNGAAQNGVLPNGPIFVPPGEGELSRSMRYRRRRRKRKRRRHLTGTNERSEIRQTGSEGEVSFTRSQSTTFPSSPDSSAVPTQQQSQPSLSPPTPTAEQTTSPPPPQGLVTSTSLPASLDQSQAHVPDSPPDYEDALHMRIAEPPLYTPAMVPGLNEADEASAQSPVDQPGQPPRDQNGSCSGSPRHAGRLETSL